MNKLISRNPIQRFKEGRKIVKFQNSGRFVRAGRSTMGFPVWADTQTGNLYTSDIAGRRDPNRDFGTSDWKQWTDEGQTLTYHSLSRNGVIKGSDYIRKTSTPTVSTTNVTNSSNTSEMSDRAAAKARIAQSNRNQVPANQNKGGKKTVNKTNARGTVTSVAKPTPTSFMGQGIQQGWRGTVGKAPELTDQQKLQLINTGKFTDNDFATAGALQTALNNYFGGTVGSISVDNKWGSQSQKALNAALAATKDPGTYMNLSQSLDLPNLDGTKTRTNIHGRYNITGLLSNKMTNPTPTINLTTASPAITPQVSNVNVNRAQTRNLMRAHNLNPYDYSGAQRKALRNFYSTGNYDSNLLSGIISKDYKWLKQGGLISRNPVKQFKSNFRKEAL